MNLEQRDGGIGMSELKPCPFCGVQPELIGDRIYAKHGQFCILYSQVVYDFKKTAWNTRPIEDELRAKLKVAESDLALLSISLDHSNQGDPVIRLVNESVKKTLARIKE